MPLIPGLLRRRGPSSEDMRRHSFLSPESPTPSNPTALDGRASEQIPRRPSAAEFLSPQSAADGAFSRRTSAESQGRSTSPVQEENHKYRRFSMLKFRHASDSQLSTRARQQAQAESTPPIPQREHQDYVPPRVLASC